MWPAQQDHILLGARGEGQVLLLREFQEHLSRMQLRPHLAQPFLPPLPQLPVTCPQGILFPPLSEFLSCGAVIRSSGASLLPPHDPRQLKGKELCLIHSYNHSLDKHLLCGPCSARPRGGWWALLIRSSWSSSGTVKVKCKDIQGQGGSWIIRKRRSRTACVTQRISLRKTTLFSRHSRGRKGGSEERKEGKVGRKGLFD